MSRVQLLLAQTDEVYARLRQRLAGLTDDEYFWKPVPDPAPFTTIGWRLVHVADCKVMYHEWAFGPRKLTFPDLAPPATAAGAVARLEEGHQREVRNATWRSGSGAGGGSSAFRGNSATPLPLASSSMLIPPTAR